MNARVLTIGLSLLLGSVALIPGRTSGQEIIQASGYEISDTFKTIDVMAGSSRRVNFAFNIPEVHVENPDIFRASCISSSEINITGVKPGVATLTVADPEKKLHSITVNVVVDTRKLVMTLNQYFPDSAINVTPLQVGVLLTGYVARAEDVNNVLAVTQDFFPTNVVNQLRVDGSQVVATEVKVYEVSRSRLRNLGIDWGVAGPNGRIVSGFSDLISDFAAITSVGQNATVSVLSNSTTVTAVLNALEQKNVAKLMTQPTLISQNGRPAELLSGGEIPIQVQSGLGTNSIQFRAFGTKLDVVPIVHGQGEMTLEVRAEVSEIAPELAGTTGVPGFRVRRVNTSAPMRSGQTLVLAGVYSETSGSEVKGAPGLVNKPILGAFFRNSSNQSNETELVFLLTPRTAAPVDAGALPAVMPGRNTTNPSSFELFGNGYLEVPKCGPQCAESNPYITQQAPVLAPAPDQAPTPMAPVPADDFGPTQVNPPAEPVSPQSYLSPVNGSSIQPASYSGGDDYFRNSSPPPKETTGTGFGFPQTSGNYSVINGTR